MFRHSRVVAVTLLLAATFQTACLSLTAKQKVHNTHQSIRAALVAVDEFERQLCQPVPAAVNTCGAVPRVIQDADHQRISRLLSQAFAADVRIGEAIVAWQPGTPAPSSLLDISTYVQQIGAIVQAILPNDPRVQEFLGLIQAVLAAVSQTTVAFGRV